MGNIDWQHVESITIIEAACLLVGIDPSVLRTEPRNINERNATLHLASLRGSTPWEHDLIRAVKTRVLHAARVCVRSFGGEPYGFREVDPATVSVADVLESGGTTITPTALVSWCGKHNAPIPTALAKIGASQDTIGTYPEQLRAAIEAFEAVHSDAVALRGRSPKTALLEWLEQHKPKLSANARERIATVANWQPTGGAPKTPA